MVYIYDSANNEWIVREAAPGDPLPGTVRGSVTVAEFLGPCRTDILWSDLRALKALQRLQDCSPTIDTRVRCAFRRLSEGVYTGQSAHYAGLAFDIGKNLTTKEQQKLMAAALERCGFDRVEPPYATPGWLHVEKQIAPPASALGEYPVLREGDEGVHVLLLQDALSLLGFHRGMLTGKFGAHTAAALRDFQRQAGLRQAGIRITGVSDGDTWHALLRGIV